MSYIETAVLGSKRIEKILRAQFSAQGRGLHEYLSDVAEQLPEDVVQKARYIASVRNKVVHEDEIIYDLDRFNQTVEKVVTELLIIQDKKINKPQIQNHHFSHIWQQYGNYSNATEWHNKISTKQETNQTAIDYINFLQKHKKDQKTDSYKPPIEIIILGLIVGLIIGSLSYDNKRKTLLINDLKKTSAQASSRAKAQSAKFKLTNTARTIKTKGFE